MKVEVKGFYNIKDLQLSKGFKFFPSRVVWETAAEKDVVPECPKQAEGSQSPGGGGARPASVPVSGASVRFIFWLSAFT